MNLEAVSPVLHICKHKLEIIHTIENTIPKIWPFILRESLNHFGEFRQNADKNFSHSKNSDTVIFEESNTVDSLFRLLKANMMNI